MKSVKVLAGVCLLAVGCGGPSEGTGSSSSSSSGAGGAGGNEGSTASSSAASTASSSATGTGGAGPSCQATDVPITPNPWTDLDCQLSTLTAAGHALEAGRIPGWVHPMLVDQVTVLASPYPLDGMCTLDASFGLFVTVDSDPPTAPVSAWTKVAFNPKIKPTGDVQVPVVVNVPPQLVKPGQNLYVALDTAGDTGRFCFGICQNKSDWTWAGSDLGALAAQNYQATLSAHGSLQLDCEPLYNNDLPCALNDSSSLTAAPTEDGDLIVERLIPGADVLVSEILFEMIDGDVCVLPDNVELIYFVGAKDAPVGGSFTEAKVPKASAYRINNGLSAFSQKVDPPLLVPKGQALYAGIRQHPTPNGTCMGTCAGADALPGDGWWGHTHKQPGQVVWASLASEGFKRSLLLYAIYAVK